MSGIALLIAIVAIVVLAIVFLAVTARKSDRNAATGLLARETLRRDRARAKAEKAAALLGTTVAPPPADGRGAERSVALARRGVSEDLAVSPPVALPDLIRPPMDYEQLGVTRRQFLNRGITAMMIAGLGAFGGAVLAFLWPSLSGGFGAKVSVGKLDDILQELSSSKGPKYVAEARTYLVPYPTEKVTLEKARKVYSAGVFAGMENVTNSFTAAAGCKTRIVAGLSCEETLRKRGPSPCPEVTSGGANQNSVSTCA